MIHTKLSISLQNITNLIKTTINMEQGTNSYISFMLGEEYFAINVGKVLNILQLVQITKVPTAPDYMKGVINLRGTVLPIIDVRMKFGMEPNVAQSAFPHVAVVKAEVWHKHGLAGQRVEHTTLIV